PPVTLLATLAATSQRVAATPARLVKVRELAALLRSLRSDEIEIVAHYLSGEPPQGRIGIGYATLADAAQAPAATATLSVADVDRQLTALTAARGSGSAERRAALLRELFSPATAAEQPAPLVRRAAMYAGNLGTVARVALTEGAAGLARFQLELFKPVAPMLAQTAADVGAALRELTGEVALEWKMDGARIQVHKRADEVRLYTRALNDITAA